MGRLLFTGHTLLRSSTLTLTLGCALSACSDGDTGREGSTGGTANSGGQTATGGQSATGGQTPTGGGAAEPTGGTAAGGDASGGESSNTGGATGGGIPGGGDSGGGTASTGGDGSGGDATGGDGSGGGSPVGECTRELLDGLLDDYFAALSAGDPSGLPLSANVKFTENAEVTEIGTTAFWMNAGDTKHSQRLLDTQECSAAAQAVVPEGAMDLPIAVRIKVEDAELTEIETIVVRPGDYTASFAVASNTAAIIAIADEIGWHDEVPQGERATRAELTSWIDKYFRAFPSGVCDVTGACKRLENGGGDFSCSTGASCSATDPGAGGTFEPRIILADEVRGIAAGFTIFDFMTTGHLDMHMMKMSGGQVHAVQAILRDTNGASGWD